MFPAVVVRRNQRAGTYHLQYDDGDQDPAVPAASVHAMGPGTLVATLDAASGGVGEHSEMDDVSEAPSTRSHNQVGARRRTEPS